MILCGNFLFFLVAATMSVTGQEVVPSMATWIREENVACWLRQCSMSLQKIEISFGIRLKIATCYSLPHPHQKKNDYTLMRSYT